MLHGQVAYRDFFLFYTPGSVYIQAALFKLFGDSLAIARMGIAFVGAACSVVTYSLARRVCSRTISLLAAGLTTAVSVTYRFVVVHNWYSTLFAMLALYAAIRLLETGQRRWGFITGSLTALTILIEQSKGPALMGGLAIGYLVLLTVGGKKLPGVSDILAFAIGFAWPFAPTLLYFASEHAIAAMFQGWLWPIHHYTQANHVFYGHLSWSEEVRNNLHTGYVWADICEYFALSPLVFVAVLPLIGLAWLTDRVISLWKKKYASPRDAYFVLMSAASAGLLLSILIVRTDITHFMYLTPLWYVVLAWILEQQYARYRLLATLRSYLTAYALVAFGMLGFALVLSVNGAKGQVETRRGMVTTSYPDQVISAAEGRIPAGNELLVYPYLPLYNYLTATHSPASLDFFQAGMSTREQAQGIIDSLYTHKTQWVLFDPQFVGRIPYVWPETPIADLVDGAVPNYIVRNYHSCQILKTGSGLSFQLMRVNGQECSAPN